MKKIKKYFSIILLLFLSFTISAQQSMLDLTQPDQQKDFLKYIKSTVSLLNDSSIKGMMKGYNLKNFSDNNKEEVGKKIMTDTGYFKRLMDHFAFMQILETKYRITKFSSEDWNDVTRFGAKHGIYFISAMNKSKEQKDTFPNIPLIFPIIPLKTLKDTIPSPNFFRK